jgi:hypothetical protein
MAEEFMADSTEKRSRLRRFADIDKWFCWSTIGAIIGIASLIAAFYYAVIYTKSANLRIDVLSNTNVADISADPGKLDILYGGKSIKSVGNALSVITFRIVNDGNAPLRKDSFTTDSPLGIVLTEGEIVDVPQATEASMDYLRKTMKATRTDVRTVTFSSAVMHPGDYIGFRLLVIHGASEQPIDLKPIGVSADVSDVTVSRVFESQPTKSFWAEAFSGSALTQIVRFIAYFVLSIITIVAIIYLLMIPDSIKRRVRWQMRDGVMNRFRAGLPADTDAGIVSNMFERYRECGKSEIECIKKVMDRRVSQGGLDGGDWGILSCAKVLRHSDSGKPDSGSDLDERAHQLYAKFLSFLEADEKAKDDPRQPSLLD